MQASVKRDRRSIWLSSDKYNALSQVKSRYERANGSTDWGSFLLFIAGVALANRVLSDILDDSEKKE